MRVRIIVLLANKIYDASIRALMIFCFVIVSSSIGNAQIVSPIPQIDCDSGLVERVFTNRYITETRACMLLNQQKTRAESAEENLEMLVQENVSFREKIQELNAQFADVQQKLSTSNETSNAQGSELKACSLQRERLHAENIQLIEEHQALLSQYEALSFKQSEAKNQNLRFEVEVNELKEKSNTKNTELNQKVSLLERQLENCQQELAGKNAELRKQNETFSAENMRLSSERANIQTENEILKARFSEATAALEEAKILARKTGALTSQLAAKDIEIERLENALKVAQNADAVYMKKKATQAMRKLVIDFQSTDKNIETTMNNDALSVLVSDIFKSGSMRLSSDADVFLDGLAATMISLIDGDSTLPYRFAVIGHADKMPVSSSKFSSNWELSASRAAAIVKALIDRGIEPRRVLAAGQAEFDPIDLGDTKEALKNNRRIEIRIY